MLGRTLYRVASHPGAGSRVPGAVGADCSRTAPDFSWQTSGQSCRGGGRDRLLQTAPCADLSLPAYFVFINVAVMP